MVGPAVLVSSSAASLPDAPLPAGEALEAGQTPAQEPAPGSTPAQQTPSAQPAQNNPGQASGQSSSSAQAPAAQTSAEQSRHEKAEEELKEQEKQRVMGVMATFNTTTNKDAAPLSGGQKFKLFIKSANQMRQGNLCILSFDRDSNYRIFSCSEHQNTHDAPRINRFIFISKLYS